MMETASHSDTHNQGANLTEPRVFVYSVDHADHIVAVDDRWLEFARDNAAPELTRESVEGQNIWSFIGDVDTQLIYRMVFDAVRTKMRPMIVSYRCDSPTLRRYMQLICLPKPKLAIEIRSYITHEEPRPYVALLDSELARSDEVVTICAWCKKCKLNEFDWREIEDALPELELFSESMLPQVSHGMCPDCHLDKLKAIRSGKIKP